MSSRNNTRLKIERCQKLEILISQKKKKFQNKTVLTYDCLDS